MHYVLAASSASVWGNCPGSVVLAAKYPQDATEATIEGQAAHWCAEQVIAGRRSATSELVGEADPDGTEITEEMAESAAVYVSVVLSDKARTGAESLIEHRVNPRALIHPLNGGTLDFALVDHSAKRVSVYDYKHGFLAVEVQDNLQLVNYAAGLFEELQIDPADRNGYAVDFTIVQPRAHHVYGPVRRCSYPPGGLSRLIAKLQTAAKAAIEKENYTVAGDQCIYCPARARCKSSNRALWSALQAVGSAAELDLSSDDLGAYYALVERAKDQISAVKTGLEEEIEALLASGKPVAGYALVSGKGRSRFKGEVTEAGLDKYSRMLGVKLVKEVPLTPRQAMAAGVNEDFIKALTFTPLGKAKVTKVEKTIAFTAFNQRKKRGFLTWQN